MTDQAEATPATPFPAGPGAESPRGAWRWLIGLILFTIIPIALSLYLSFTQWNVVKPPVWIGIDNYVRMFTNDPDFYQSLKVTVLFTVTSVPLQR